MGERHFHPKARDVARDFTCAVCQRSVEMRWNRPGRCMQIAPVCWYCECEYTRGVGKPVGGTIRDRRNVSRGLALAEALRSEAARQTWQVR